MYLGGYAVECSLAALLCKEDGVHLLTKTKVGSTPGGLGTLTRHDLTALLNALPRLKRLIEMDRVGTIQKAWNLVMSCWKVHKLRYWDRLGDKDECLGVLEASALLHKVILDLQGEH